MIALIRAAGYDRPIYLHGALERITRYYDARGIELGELPRCARKKAISPARSRSARRALQDLWSRRFADPVTASPRAGCG